nr:DUF3320 domain-containing protein [Frigoribacterium sp. CFBP 8766]
MQGKASNADERVRVAIKQWRDSLVNLSGRNRLLNYRPTRSSTIEFTRHCGSEVYERITADQLTYTLGIRPPAEVTAVDASDDQASSEALEQAVLSQLGDLVDPDQYPDHLFADKTQRDVDRALRTLASTSKREFIDKGLHTLYVALGELRWLEDSGDSRRSPLLLVPTELSSLGPRERMSLAPSDDDIVVNPALALMLSDQYGIQIPDAEDVLPILDQSGFAGVLEMFRGIEWPAGWVVDDFAALGVFAFAKEAMYRDLLDHEDVIASSELVQALSGGITAEASEFLFEPHGDKDIDDVAPPETVPLVLDADASQRAAVQAAVAGRSFTLDGPPGTGKSQTISNMIGGLIAAGKSVLFVSEKAVALDVVRNRLTENGLGTFLFELHSSKAVRKDVAARLGDALSSAPVPPVGMSALKLGQLREARQALTDYAIAANEIRSPLDLSFHQALGQLEQVRTDVFGPRRSESAEPLSAATLAAITDAAGRLQEQWPLATQGDRSIWYGFRHQGPVEYQLRQLAQSLERLQPFLHEGAALRAAFQLDSLDDLARITQLVDLWFQGADFHVSPWLDVDDIDELTAAVTDYELVTRRQVSVESVLVESAGPDWDSLPPLALEEIPALDDIVEQLPGVGPFASGEYAMATAQALRAASEAADQVVALSSELAETVGALPPGTAGEAGMLVNAVHALLSMPQLQASWLYDPTALSEAEAAASNARAAQEALGHAEHAARGAFNQNVLEIDLSSVEALASSNKGLLKRFTADHKTLRSQLATLSSSDWKSAVDALPLARTWANANRRATAEVLYAQSLIGPAVKTDWTTSWQSVDQYLRTSRTAASVPYRDRGATERALASRLAPQQLMADLGRALEEWESVHKAWLEPLLVRDPSFAEIQRTFTERSASLAPIISVVNAQISVVGHAFSVRDHLKVAQARMEHVSAVEASNAARDRVERAAPNSVAGAAASSAGAAKASRHLRWVKSLLMAAPNSKSMPSRLTNDQIRALQRASPLVGAAAPFDRYRQIRDEVVDWFDEQRQSELRHDLEEPATAVELTAAFLASVEEIDDWHTLRWARHALDAHGLGSAIEHAIEQDMPTDQVANFLVSTSLRGWIDSQLAEDDRLGATDRLTRDDLVDRFRTLDAELSSNAVTQILTAGAARRPRSSLGQAAVIRREAEKKRKHIAVRDLIAEARDVILALHPCFMMSPLAVSQFLPPEQLFDVVIFDEASQVLPADAINCIYRGAALITAGDQKQLPPTSFFEIASEDSDEGDENDVAKDYESILDLMKSSGAFTPQSLRWHYRSRHEHLIAYSNASFYDSRLITFPGAIAESSDAGVHFLKVAGVYRRSGGRDNPIEAKHVAERVMHHFTTRPDKSVGVVAFSTAQRDAIESALELARAARPDLDHHFDDDRVAGFFVKSLESVQGDERDVIIFSIGYGPDEHGKVYRQFGPIGRSGGERRLNVAITRARELVEVVSSMSAADIGEVSAVGTRHLRRYLDFAERGTAALAMELGPAGLDTESPFEDAVLAYVQSLGFDVQPQVGVAGYRIDLGVKHPNKPGAFMLGLECDGAMYHSSRAARDRDRLRHNILEKLGWRIHHIWGTAWYRHPDREKERLRTILETLASGSVGGRLAANTLEKSAPVLVETVPADLDAPPDWLEQYDVASEPRISRNIDLGDALNAYQLVNFVRNVARTEAPLHIDVLSQRVREHSTYDRIGSRIRTTLVLAVAQAGLEFDGAFIRHKPPLQVRVRRNTQEFSRPIEHVPNEELESAIELLVTDAVGVHRTEIVARTALTFGWRRSGSDIRYRVESSVDALLEQGRLIESSDGLRIGNQS